jgi:hypothetical protein
MPLIFYIKSLVMRGLFCGQSGLLRASVSPWFKKRNHRGTGTRRMLISRKKVFNQYRNIAVNQETLDLSKTALITPAIFSPFSRICSSVHNKEIEVEMQRLMMASLAEKSF